VCPPTPHARRPRCGCACVRRSSLRPVCASSSRSTSPTKRSTPQRSSTRPGNPRRDSPALRRRAFSRRLASGDFALSGPLMFSAPPVRGGFDPRAGGGSIPDIGWPLAEELRAGEDFEHRVGEEEDDDHVDDHCEAEGECEAAHRADGQDVEDDRGEHVSRPWRRRSCASPGPSRLRRPRAGSCRCATRLAHVRSRR
jgi:hypothetical protein